MIEKSEKDIMKLWEEKYCNTPQVSVKCITFNQAKFISNAIDSFLSQITTFPFEIVIHDDCSTDGTQEVLKKYQKRYPNIITVLFEEENQYSKGNSINEIMKPYLNGTYIALCEGDDCWCDSFKLQKQYEFMIKNPDCSLCCHNTVINYLDNNKKNKNFNSWKVVKKMNEAESFFGWNVHTSSYFYPSSLNYHPECRKGFWSGDYVYLTLAMYYGNVYVLPDIMSVYNANNPTGVTMQNKNDDYDRMIKRQRSLISYLKKYNEFTNNRYQEIVSARVCESLLKISDKPEELVEAARSMSHNKFFWDIFKIQGSIKDKIKFLWKFKGYKCRTVWLYSIKKKRDSLRLMK